MQEWASLYKLTPTFPNNFFQTHSSGAFRNGHLYISLATTRESTPPAIVADDTSELQLQRLRYKPTLPEVRPPCHDGARGRNERYECSVLAPIAILPSARGALPYAIKRFSTVSSASGLDAGGVDTLLHPVGFLRWKHPHILS